VWFLIEANLAQNVKSAACWFDGCLFHPCLVAGLNRQANTFFNFRWDDCGFVSLNAICLAEVFVAAFPRPCRTLQDRGFNALRFFLLSDQKATARCGLLQCVAGRTGMSVGKLQVNFSLASCLINRKKRLVAKAFGRHACPAGLFNPPSETSDF
jgi:hypothetical protein